jgi:hypothetical protein
LSSNGAGRSFVILNWVLQMLCAMQTEVLRNQVIDLHSQAQAYPRLIHSVKQVSASSTHRALKKKHLARRPCLYRISP